MTPKDWRRLAMLWLESAELGRCLVHPECASSASFGVGPSDQGVECWRHTVSQWDALTSAEHAWLTGAKCKVCQYRHHAANRRRLQLLHITGSWVAWYRSQHVWLLPDRHAGCDARAWVPSARDYVRQAHAPRNGDAHHHCPKAQKPNEAPPLWRARIWGTAHEADHA